jgi:HK97 family phage portal protein
VPYFDFKNILPLQGPFPLTSDRLLDYIGGSVATSGAKVNQETVMGIPAAYACNRVLSWSIAMLPLLVFERLEPRGRRHATDYPLYTILKDEPNRFMSSFQYRATAQWHLGFQGNHFSEIELSGDGMPRALWPLNPTKMLHPVVSRAGSLIYPYILPDGTGVEIPERRILHIRGISFDGIWGYAPLTVFREAFGMTLAAREYGSRFWSQGAKPGGVLQAKGKLTKDAAERMASSWSSAHQGLSMSHRVAVLEEGVEWKSVGMSNEDAQFAESQQFGLGDMARIWGVKRHKIEDLADATFSNIEQQSIEHITDTVQPWAVDWEQQLSKDLIPKSDRQRYYAKFMLNGLLRGDMAARANFYATLFDRAALSPDDIREFEDMDLIPDGLGDRYYRQQNMAVVGQEQAPIESAGQGASST